VVCLWVLGLVFFLVGVVGGGGGGGFNLYFGLESKVET
jgi:hypothetical protein